MALSQPELRGRRARHYDFTANLYYLLGFREWWYRKQAVRALRLAAGATAAERTRRKGWKNVELVRSDASSFAFPNEIRGILSTFALTLVPEYDQVIERGARALAPGGRWVVADLKWPKGWAGRLLPVLLPLFAPFGVTRDLAERHPWESVCAHTPVVAR